MKKNIIFIILFIITNFLLFELLKEHSIMFEDGIKSNKEEIVKNNFNIIKKNQKVLSFLIYKDIISNKEFLKIQDYKKERKKIYKFLKEKYEELNQEGVNEIQIILKDGTSFIKMNNIDDFGEKVTIKRKDIEKLLKNQEEIKYTSNNLESGFKNIFPLYINDEFIGILEISFSINTFQKNLININKLKSYFLLNMKSNNDTKYKISIKNIDYSLLHNENFKNKCIDKLSIDELSKYKNLIKIKMEEEKIFSIVIKETSCILTLMPIKNINKEIISWIVSFQKSNLIKKHYKITMIIKIAMIFITAMIFLLVYRILYNQKTLNDKNDLINEVLNKNEDLIIISNLRNIKYSNNKFKDFFEIKSNNEIDKCLFKIFEAKQGFLFISTHFTSNDFFEIYNKSSDDKKIVILKNKKGEDVIFKINITKLNNDDYFINLTDITKYHIEKNNLMKEAFTDNLTGVYNRSMLNKIFEETLNESKENNKPFALIIADIDFFKKCNDEYGHDVGDDVLINFANIINNKTRRDDIFARWGGEEFMLIIKETNLKNTIKIMNKIQEEIRKYKHPIAGKITASFGITLSKIEDNFKTMYKRCDDALYKAKENGRDRIEYKL